MDLISVSPELNIYDETWPIWTYQEQLPPAKFVFDDDDRRGMAVDSMVSGGCIISGAKIKRSLLFSRVAVNSYTELNDTLVLPNVAIGRNCKIHKTILDEDCVIPDGTVIGEDLVADAERFYVTEGGVVLVTPQMLGLEVYQVR
jgi:glucose-1-phosphate adenylyltransferase